MAGLQHDFVQLHKQVMIRRPVGESGEIRKLQTVLAGAGFIQDFAEAEDVSGRRSWTLRRNVAFGADVGLRLAGVGYQANVSEFGDAIEENNIGGLDVPMDQSVLVQFGQGLSQSQCE